MKVFYKIFVKLLYKVRFIKSSLIKKAESLHYIEQIHKSGGEVGDNFEVGKDVVISGLSKIKIGKNVKIGSGCFIRGDGGLNIGDNVVISRNVVIYTNSHNYLGVQLPFDTTYINSPVAIGDNVWIGMNVTISPGSNIGEGVIIALGSRVWGEIEPLCIVGSPKPNVLKKRDEKHYAERK